MAFRRIKVLLALYSELKRLTTPKLHHGFCLQSGNHLYTRHERDRLFLFIILSVSWTRFYLLTLPYLDCKRFQVLSRRRELNNNSSALLLTVKHKSLFWIVKIFFLCFWKSSPRLYFVYKENPIKTIFLCNWSDEKYELCAWKHYLLILQLKPLCCLTLAFQNVSFF